jgi:serine/threonine protein kinase
VDYMHEQGVVHRDLKVWLLIIKYQIDIKWEGQGCAAGGWGPRELRVNFFGNY